MPVLAVLALAMVAFAHAGLAEAAPGDVGHRGHSFAADAVVDPTGQKPQSKLWFHDGIWWGSLFRPSAGTNGEFRIHRLDPATHQWLETGTVLDDRNSSEADVLWDGTFLYVASGSDTTPELRLYRYRYDPSARTYLPDSGFPIQIGTSEGPVEAVVLAKDTTGRLWITFERGGVVFVAHSGASDAAWSAPMPLPVPGAANLNEDDISAVVAFEGKMGVMWSNQTDEKVYFAEHVDGAGDMAWTRTTAFEGPRSADDHINLKSLQADPAGQVFAAVKTSHGDGPGSTGAAQVVLLALGAGGWTAHTVGTVADDHTRPIVLTNRVTRRLYVLATAPTGGGTIYLKEASLDNPIFAPGLGTPFMRSAGAFLINDATSTKQDLGPAPGLLALASDDTNYWHNLLAPVEPAPVEPAPVGPAPGGGGSAPGAGGSAPGAGTSGSAPGAASPGSNGTSLSTADGTRPSLSALSVTPASFRPTGLRAAGRRRAGAMIRLRLSERARVWFAVRRRGRRAVVGRFELAGVKGRNAVRFRGRLRGRVLPAGRYLLVVVAVDGAGNRSAAKRAAFRIVR